MIAEQLLLACAAKVSDTLNTDIAIKYSLENFLSDLPDDIRWVDGSGLSRYNLFTPRSIVKLWEKIYEEVPQVRLFKLLAVGGQPGTLSNLYQGSQPFVFGKTGSLSNNHCLSGYLITKKGKIYIFSFMNSNFVASSKEIRTMIQNLLINLHNKY
jgi:D-alanyl-D-alanine carboxypeptidase/D-alanyl-D-alanine-endopeptidase (penicillin-binding protein 4)